MNRQLQRNNIVLLGLGHTNAHVAKMWRMSPIAGANLICVSDFPLVTYSGMMPGVLSGQYNQEQMEIDLVRYCAVSGIRLIVDRVTAVNVSRRCLEFASRPALHFDWLSIGIGSQPTGKGLIAEDQECVVPIKPMQTFLRRFRVALTKVTVDCPVMTIVGAGAGGIEIAFALNQRLKNELGQGQYRLRLLSGSELGVGLLPQTCRLVKKKLFEAEIEMVEQQTVVGVTPTHVLLGDGRQLESHVTIWATSAEASELLRSIALPQDSRGFLLTKPTLQSTGSDRIFVVGDSGTLERQPTAKAGVYAVRQGPVLWKNLKRAVGNQRLISFKPQKHFLKLLNLGNGQAIAEYFGRSVVGTWCWSLKDYIDRKFMRMYQDYKPLEMTSSKSEIADGYMRCLGCGGKLGGASLAGALDRLNLPANENVIIGLESSDDAAVIRTKHNCTTVTADFFAAPFDDPYMIGRIAALNSASDCFAMNARPTAAITMAQVPLGHPKAQSDVLHELLAGAQLEFSAMGATIAGGHSIEGPRLTVGFTVLADQLGDITQKGNLRAGDHLVLSKPLGIGILLAANMRGLCRAVWFTKMLDAMLTSNQIALVLTEKYSISAMTDVTGFGLAGHLLEMLHASTLAAEIQLKNIPVLDGVDTLLDRGIESSLMPENRELAKSLEIQSSDRSLGRRRQVLFDPQTSGGLLLGVRPEETEAVLSEFHQAGNPFAAVIGRVVKVGTGEAKNLYVS